MPIKSPGFLALVLTTVAILLKGLPYLSLGRPLTLLLAIIPVIAVLLTVGQGGRASRIFSKLWAWLLLLWSGARLVLSIALRLPDTITENHVFEQFGVLGNLVTISACVAAILILREVKRARAQVRGEVRAAS